MRSRIRLMDNTMRKLSTRFRSYKNYRQIPTASSANHKQNTPDSSAPSSSSSVQSRCNKSGGGGGGGGGKQGCSKTKRAAGWSVYLIFSTRLSRTYVGVTTNFTRRLKQHNGILKGGAKACSVGRPWALACIIRGFMDRSEACELESRWKIASRKMSRKKEDSTANPLLEHRQAALDRIRKLFDWSRLQIEWQSF